MKYGGKRFNRFNSQTISNNNSKRMTQFASYFAELLQKNIYLKPSKVAIFGYNNTELICKEYLTIT